MKFIKIIRRTEAQRISTTVEYIRKSVDAFNIPSIELVLRLIPLATYAKKIMKAGAKVTIISSNELMQLVSKNVRLYDPMKSKVLGEEVLEKFGVKPNQVMTSVPCGDSSDNIPGVSGIGIKTAAINK